MTQLRFCMLTTFYPPYNFGGDGIGVQRLSRALVKLGHEVDVVHDVDAYNCLSRTPDPAGSGEPDGVRVIGLRSGLGAASVIMTQQLGRPIANRRKLAEIVDAGHYDVVWFHNVSLIGGPGLLGIGDSLRIYEAHEHWLVCPTHVLWRDNREPCTERSCLRCTLRHKRPPQAWRYTGFLERQVDYVDAFIAKSEFSRQKHWEFGFPRPMEVVPYFLPDADERSAPMHDAPHHRPYFLFVGRLERIKGLDDVIPVFREYADADLLIAGAGDDGARLRTLASDNRRICFLGRVTPDELRRYYEHAIALIVPSVCFETFGIILIEAFRQGTPVIARRIGPFPEIVATSSAGEIFANRTELITAMERVQRQHGHRQQLADNAAEAFARHWSESAVMPQYLGVVRDAAIRTGRSELAARLAEEIAV